MYNYDSYPTERRNPRSMEIDCMSAIEIATLINEEDKTVPFAVEKELQSIAAAIEGIAARLKDGGRLFYIGAGTSGRIGVVDAAECPPTYGTPPETVQALIAGGQGAMFRAVEGAEDNGDLAVEDLLNTSLTEKDAVVGISASGSAEYVRSGLLFAKKAGALTVALSCNKQGATTSVADIAIAPEVGAEVISGSTRMKAGTAQKIVVTMISTGVMVLLGRVRGNLLVHMDPSNKKLIDRATRIICSETGAGAGDAREALIGNNNDILLAIQELKNKGTA